MQDVIKASALQTGVRARLVGGPADFRPVFADSSGRAPGVGSDKTKVAHQGGYEHFERAPEPADSTHAHGADVLFRWTMRTEAAE